MDCLDPFFRLPTMCEAKFELETASENDEDVNEATDEHQDDGYLHREGFLLCGGGGGGM